jgi:hypothetical protein
MLQQNEGFGRAIDFFNTHGYDADIGALRELYPGLMTFKRGWTRRADRGSRHYLPFLFRFFALGAKTRNTEKLAMTMAERVLDLEHQPLR